MQNMYAYEQDGTTHLVVRQPHLDLDAFMRQNWQDAVAFAEPRGFAEHVPFPHPTEPEAGISNISPEKTQGNSPLEKEKPVNRWNEIEP